MGMFYGSKTHKQRVVDGLIYELFGDCRISVEVVLNELEENETSTPNRIRDIISKLTTADLEYLYHIKTGRSGI